MAPRTPAINYYLESELSITLCCQLRMLNLLHSITNQELFSVIKVATMKLIISITKESHHVLPPNQLWYAKRHLSGQSSEKINPVALAVIKLRLSEGSQSGRQSVRQSVSRKFRLLMNSIATC